MSTTSQQQSLTRRTNTRRLRTRDLHPTPRRHDRQQAAPQNPSLTPLMGPANHAPGQPIMGAPSDGTHPGVMGGPDTGPRVSIMGDSDRGTRLNLFGDSDPSFVDSLFTPRSGAR
jgi:hypothetical protein